MTRTFYSPAQSAIAIVPARGGSKGIPRKNLVPLLGIPMLSYTLRAAREVEEISKVLVSTDNEEIAEVARAEGALVIERPVELARDDSPTEPCIVHAMDRWREREGADPDWVVLLQPTAPLRQAEDIRRAFQTLESTGADSILSVVERREFRWVREGEMGRPLWDIENRPRRQDLIPDYVENGAIYITRSSLYREGGNRLGGSIALSVMPAERSIDVDEPSDLLLVENFLRKIGCQANE
jgi:N-acylneuraminate cytidylyltransferase